MNLRLACSLASAMLLCSCAKRPSAPLPPSPAAFGTQLVETSGGKQAGGVGSRLADPVVVQVNSADGSPVAGALVTFRGQGLLFTAAASLTDASGQVSAVVQLGSIPGIYSIVAETPKSGGGTVTLALRETALGYQEKLGKEISDAYCVFCHSPESTTERVSNYDNLTPPLPHLFSDGAVLNAMSDAELIKIITDGGPALGKSPQTPAYRDTLTPAQIRAIVAYMRAVADPPPGKPAND